jgi:uncharacterized protein
VSIYLDTSALAKLVVTETESKALRAWLGRRRGTSLVTNSIGVLELLRMAARVSQGAVAAATLLLAHVDQLALTPRALDATAQLPPPEVRTLDALHVASATELADLQTVLTYDRRMADACTGYGLSVTMPGARLG